MKILLIALLLLLTSISPSQGGFFKNDDFQVEAFCFELFHDEEYRFIDAWAKQEVVYARAQSSFDVIPQIHYYETQRYEVRPECRAVSRGNGVELSIAGSCLALDEENPNEEKGGSLRDLQYSVTLLFEDHHGQRITAELLFFDGSQRKNLELARSKSLEKKIKRRFHGTLLDFRFTYGSFYSTAPNKETGDHVAVRYGFSQERVRMMKQVEKFEELHGEEEK